MLPDCKDPALTFLKGKGYNVVRLPKSDIRPTQLMVRNGKRLRRIGDLDTVFIAHEQAPIPAVSGDNPNATISGQKSADLDIGVGLNILGGLISALGGSTLALNIGYQSARSVQFEFADVVENNAQTTLLDQFLTGATVNPFALAVAQMLEADSVYVITSTLKSARINVIAKDQSKTAVSVDVPVLQQAIGGNVAVTAAGAESSLVSYQGRVPLVFGFQAVRLIFDNGKYRSMKVADSGALTLEAAPAEDLPGDEMYLVGDGLVDLDL